MPTSVIDFVFEAADNGRLGGFGPTVGDWETCRRMVAGGGGLMYGWGDRAEEKRYDRS